MKNLFKKIIIPVITWQAMHLLGRKNPKIIAITGSVGKTSTKEVIFHFLKSSFNVRASEKSFNSEIGVPLTILGLKNAWLNPFLWASNIIKGFFVSFFSKKYPDVLVLEIGADKPNDIGNIVAWVKPDIAVVTSLPDVPVHLENYPSVDAVHEEKLKLLKALTKEGRAILNADDPILMMKSKKLGLQNITTFSLKDDGVFIPEFVNPYPILAGVAVAKLMGLSQDKIDNLSKSFETSNGRMKKLSGINNSTIIDDTYNASPIAMQFALETLKKANGYKRKIAVLGDMRELGEFSEKEHCKVGKLAADCANLLIGVDDGGELMVDEARKFGMRMEDTVNVRNSVDAGEYLKNIIKEGDLVLFKGSQSIRMERAVLAVLHDPENNRHLLVRQDKEWKKR